MLAAVLDGDWVPRNGYVPNEWELSTRKAICGSRIWKNSKLNLEDAPIPQIGLRDVLIQVKACGICGSDVHMFEKDNKGYMLYVGLVKLPLILGHEFAGKIVKVGTHVKEFSIGDMVTAEEMNWCGKCVPCRNNYPNQCKNLEEIGFTTPGAMAKYISVDSKYCWKINEFENVYGSLDKAYEAGSLIEPISVAYNAIFVRAGGFKPGGFVVVYGAGPIGLAATALAKASGATIVIVFDTSKERGEIAKTIGAKYVYNPLELIKKGISPHEKVLEITKGVGAVLQIEAAGAPNVTLPEMEKSMAIGGKITCIGRADIQAPIFLENFQLNASQIYGSQGHSGYGTFMNVIRLIASGSLDMTPIITQRFKLPEVLKAMDQATKRIDAKILIKL